ncbi:hypothetical protein K1719_031448 [Acacia pycnantha]|nr:hypothetical protein K1719_031448 [Acacia pycnantha]
MEASISASLGFPSPNLCDSSFPTDFTGLLNHFNTITRTSNDAHRFEFRDTPIPNLTFASASMATQTHAMPTSQKFLKPSSRNSPKVQTLMKNLSVIERALIGAAGGGIAGAFTYELITQRMQVGAKGRSWEVLLKILEKDGILGLYAGYSATLLRNLPAGVLSYSSFEYLKAAVLRTTKKNHLEPLQSVMCGALAGAISASLTTPLDVVKTRLMTQVHGEAMNKVAAAVYGGVSSTVKQILKEEGWIGFTRGMGPRVLHSSCFSALGYFAFETARLTILHQYLRQKEELSEISVSSS